MVGADGERRRLAELDSFAVLDTAPEPQFDDLTRLAALVCDTPTALLTLVDERRQWFKSRVNFAVGESPRDIAFCAVTIGGDGAMVVPDASRDPRFAANPLVTGDPHIRFYAGVPLTTRTGLNVGSLAVIDYKPRELAAEQLEALRILARQAMTQLELRRHLVVQLNTTAERETAAVRAERQAEVILDASLDAIVVIDCEGRIREFNRAAERMFGYRRADVIGREMAERIIPARFQAAHRDGVARLARTGEGRILNQRLEMSALRADGSEFPIELVVTRLPDAESNAFAGFVRDITERKRIEAELRKSVERFELVQRATHDAVYDWDFRTNEVWWGDNFHTLFGYPPGDVPRTVEQWAGMIAPGDRQRILEDVERAVASSATYWSEEYLFRRGDGSDAHVLDRGYIIRDPEGAPLRMIGAMIDISALKEAEERMEQLANHVNEVFWLTDVEKRRILYINRAYETIWGRSRESLSENISGWVETVHPEDRERVLAAMPRQPLGTYDEEYRIVRPDGEVRWIRDQAFPIRGSSGRVYRIAGVAVDVTDRRLAQEQLRHAQKTEAIGRLAGGVAHDFNNILTVIQGNASLLADQVPAEEAELVREIAAAADRGAALTRQLLTAGRKQPMRLASVDLSEVATNTMRLLERLLGETIQLETRFAPDLPRVHADTGMLEQVLMNLAVNARDAMPAGGVLRITTSVVRVNPEDLPDNPDASAGTWVRLGVQDTGEGIPPHVLPRVFEPFFTTKETGKGTGLGLATVYGIVRQHYGWIDVTTAPGAGTTFDVYLPPVA